MACRTERVTLKKEATMKFKRLCFVLAVSVLFPLSVYAKTSEQPLVIQEQGSFAAGGTVVEAKETFDPYHPKSEAQTLHGDHAYVFYQIPQNPRKYPLVFLHGAGQFSKTWETSADGREGFQNIFLRRHYGVYLVDQPRRGNAGRSTAAGKIEAIPDDQFWFGQFRIGLWPKYYENSRFPKSKEALDQFFRQMTPNTGAFDMDIVSDAMKAVLEKSGESILVTHSQGGGPGWLTAIKSENVKAIAAYEPGSNFVFPEGEAPAPIENKSFFGALTALEIPLEEFKRLTQIPIVIYYGDYIPENPSDNPYQDYWRATRQMARLWAQAVNRHGGDAVVVSLPELGIYGNTHFPFSDSNNLVVAKILEDWLKEKNLD